MKHSHMSPSEAVRAFVQLRAERFMPVHWGSFRLGDEPVHFPIIEIRKETGLQGLEDKLADIRHGKDPVL